MRKWILVAWSDGFEAKLLNRKKGYLDLSPLRNVCRGGRTRWCCSLDVQTLLIGSRLHIDLSDVRGREKRKKQNNLLQRYLRGMEKVHGVRGIAQFSCYMS